MRSPRLALALLAAGCLVSAPAVAAAPAGGGDQALARSIMLRVSDLPAGWSQVPDPTKDTGCFSSILKKRAPTAYLAPHVKLVDSEVQVSAAQVVAVYGSVAAARRALTATSAPAGFACYHRALRAILARGGIDLVSFAGAPLPFAPLGDQVAAFRFSAAVTKGASKSALSLDFIFARRGRVLIETGLVDEVGQLSASGEHILLAKVLARTPATKG
jgi:hypothetical protein